MSFIGLLKLRAKLSIKAESHEVCVYENQMPKQKKKQTQNNNINNNKKPHHQQHQTGVNEMRK